MCLRCIICSIAAYNSPKYMYSSMPAEFYRRAREYAELDEMNDDGESVTLAHCQTWILIAWYEFRYLHFQRFWQSTGRALGLALMMGLNQIDNASPDINKWLPPPKDWTETEERRRTFWCCFGLDRYGSLATGSALRLDERDVSVGTKITFDTLIGMLDFHHTPVA